MKRIRIGELAQKAGSSASMIRYYEEVGLLPRPHRADSEQRLYEERDIERLRFIRNCRALGFSVEEIIDMGRLAKTPASRAPCRTIVEGRLAKVQSQIAELGRMQRGLEDILARAEHVTAPECRRIQILS